MEAAPQGLIRVSTAPSGAGQRGRRDSYDWQIISDFLSRHPWEKHVVHNVPSNLLPRLREKYPNIEFDGFARRLLWRSREDSQVVCDVYVQWTDGAHHEEAS